MNKKDKRIMLIITLFYLMYLVYGTILLKEVYSILGFGIIVKFMIAFFISIFIFYLSFMYFIYKLRDKKTRSVITRVGDCNEKSKKSKK